ncbi:V-type ATP synthase subunit A [Candidatus Margulisiibacteriota bacterium]
MGKIIKVAGPLVIAELAGGKNGDMVEVGPLKLIGEIIELKGIHASIQVYEETGGLKVGDQVTSTNAPLSVELGPGLLSAIYDGIQRPLDLIMQKSGAFISRGIKVSKLDRKKKWDFKAVKKVGDKVVFGDILGTVQETPLVVHKIMVPKGIEGRIEEIRSGKFSIEDTIATIGGMKVNMIQKRSIRQRNMLDKKESVSQQLVTGQRIIDTLFPIGLGGTAAVPGPFGAGKCVTGETPVILQDGSIKSMKDLFHLCMKNGNTQLNGLETIIHTNNPLELFSMNEIKIENSRSNSIYKGMTDSTIKIKTRTGRKIEVTPIHKLFKVTDSGKIVETEAKNLMPGDFLLSVRKIKTNNKNQPVNISQLDDCRIFDPTIREKLSSILKTLRSEKNTDNLGISNSLIQVLISKQNLPSVKVAKMIFKEAKQPLPKIKQVRGNRRGHLISFPDHVTEELAEFLGLFIAEGNLRAKTTLVFTNSEKILLDRFSFLAKKLFNCKPQLSKQKNKTACILINSKVLVDFIKLIGAGGISANKQLPEIILKSNDQAAAAFLKGFYLGDGSFAQKEIELSTASLKLQIGLSYILTRLGILHSLAERSIKGKQYYRIFIRSMPNLKLFLDQVSANFEHRKFKDIEYYINSKASSYTAIDIVPLSSDLVQSLYNLSGKKYSMLKQQGIEITNYTRNQERMSTNLFQTYIELIKEHLDANRHKDILRLASLLNCTFCDSIKEIEEIKEAKEVYDVSVPQKENFVGGFGGIILHNTVIQHQMAKWANADIVIFVGCGERGNEMTDVLIEFPELKDPKSGRPLMERTVLIANTSNMPIAAREASIYTGSTIAEYFRDMGYHVALMADSTSRWAEALREMSGRLEEMPGEEGYPAYLASRIADFYERAGYGECHGQDKRKGSLTIIGSVSPPGGDMSEPVVQNTLRVVKVFWGLDYKLAHARHFPAINWMLSYSLYVDNLSEFLTKEVAEDFISLREKALAILSKEDELEEIVRLVGLEALSINEQLILFIARSIREDFLYQSAFDPVDQYSTLKKQYYILKFIISLYTGAELVIKSGIGLDAIKNFPVYDDLSKIRLVEEERIDSYYKELQYKLDRSVKEAQHAQNK